jgi:hypothetical protein
MQYNINIKYTRHYIKKAFYFITLVFLFFFAPAIQTLSLTYFVLSLRGCRPSIFIADALFVSDLWLIVKSKIYISAQSGAIAAWPASNTVCRCRCAAKYCAQQGNCANFVSDFQANISFARYFALIFFKKVFPKWTMQL